MEDKGSILAITSQDHIFLEEILYHPIMEDKDSILEITNLDHTYLEEIHYHPTKEDRASIQEIKEVLILEVVAHSIKIEFSFPQKMKW
jgi:hypothetical protein